MNWGLFFNIIKNLKSFLSACKEYKSKTTLAFIMLLTFTYGLVQMTSFHEHQARHNAVGSVKKLTKNVDNILKGCGDRTAISISSVSISKNEKGEWPANFHVAEACDKREKNNQCIVNLQKRNKSLYEEPHFIKYNTYELLANLGTNTINSKKFNLRKNDLQNLQELQNYPSMLTIINQTEWAQLKILHNLWITAIIKNIANEKYVLYIITFLTAKPTNELSCFDQDAILNNIKNFIINN
jgi:hypothetical protein